MTFWQRWISRPQTVWLRKVIFQLHLWSGIGIGLYVFLISVTGSVLVFRNELYVAATPAPGAPSDGSIPLGITLVSKLMELHDDLLGGPTGRSINGIGALLILILAVTGIIVWWPGIRTWKRSLTVRRHTGWQRFAWDLHSMVGFWSFAFLIVFALSGAYLGNPDPVQNFADLVEPLTDQNAGKRFVDSAIYWLAYLHFGRINGIGIPCNGPGFCDIATKTVWAIFGLAPAVMFATGAMMWWNRVIRPQRKRRSEPRGKLLHDPVR